MPQRWSLINAIKDLRHVPTFIRMAAELVEAQEDVARQDYLAAERRLVRIYSLAPPGAVERVPTNLLMALVSLRLGNPSAAVHLAPSGVSHVGSLRAFANPAERAYLQYAGKLIFEEATRQLGEPKTLDIGLEFDDLDVERVRRSLREAYPVHRAHAEGDPTSH